MDLGDARVLDVIELIGFGIGIVVIDAVNAADAFRQLIVIFVIVIRVRDIVCVNNVVAGEVDSVCPLDNEEDLLLGANSNV